MASDEALGMVLQFCGKITELSGGRLQQCIHLNFDVFNNSIYNRYDENLNYC